MKIVSTGDHLHELSNRVFEIKEKNISNCRLLKILTRVLDLKIILRRTVMYILPGTLRKQAYSNILKILPPKAENFQIKI